MKKSLKFRLNIQLFATDEAEGEAENVTEDKPDYIKAIQDLKENSVPKDKYNELEEENARLLKALIDGDQVNVQQAETEGDINDKISKLHKKMFVEDYQGTDLDYCQDALELREAIMERDGEEADIFLPRGHNVLVTDYDRQAAKRVAEKMQYAIDNANGSNKLFIALLQNEIVDDPMRPQKRK